MLLNLKDVGLNPYRDIIANPLVEAKIQELMLSINTTGFWNNVVCTKRGKGYVAAYGAHRIEAAKRSGITEADFIIMDLDDAKLIQILDSENRETYASSPASVIESVQAVVQALADGTIPAFTLDPKTRKESIRYAPSYVAGKDVPAVAGRYPYTANLVAQFLGRTFSDGGSNTAVVAALNFLQLEELGAVTNAILVKDNQPISARKLFDITSEIKQRTEAVAERRGKTQAELNELREKQLAAQKKITEDAKKAEEIRKAHLQKLADAQRAEKDREADAEKAKLKAADMRAKETEATNKKRLADLETQIAAKREIEKQQKVEDAYAPIRRDVEALLSKLENIVSERNPLREQVKAVTRLKRISLVDRERLRKAALASADWFSTWVASQFVLPPSELQELTNLRKKEEK